MKFKHQINYKFITEDHIKMATYYLSEPDETNLNILTR